MGGQDILEIEYLRKCLNVNEIDIYIQRIR